VIIRVAKRRRFAVVDRTAINDSRLSFKAKGLLAYLLDKPDDWRIDRDELAKVGPDGITAIRSAISELIRAGYFVSTKHRLPNGQFHTESVLYESPPVAEKPPSEEQSPEVENAPSARRGPEAGKPEVENPPPAQAQPEAGKPEVENPPPAQAQPEDGNPPAVSPPSENAPLYRRLIPSTENERTKPQPTAVGVPSFDAFINGYPRQPNGTKPEVKKAHDVWGRLKPEQKIRAVASLPHYRRHLEQNKEYLSAKYAVRYLRDETFEDFQTPPLEVVPSAPAPVDWAKVQQESREASERLAGLA
jgi:hypothetical protein